MSRKLLFLCTGNYFRSRYAEILFNQEACQADLGWLADSRGVAIELGADNIGPISRHTVRRLAQRGWPLAKPIRFPLQLREQDLVEASRVIALKEAEHRPLLRRKFADWEDRIEYWHIDDVDCAPPEQALDRIEEAMNHLLSELRSQWTLRTTGQL